MLGKWYRRRRIIGGLQPCRRWVHELNKWLWDLRIIYTHWSMNRRRYCSQSEEYFWGKSWWVCHTRSISNVGTKNDAGEEDIRSKKLYEIRKIVLAFEVVSKRYNAYAWYLAIACWSANSSPALSKYPARVQPRSYIFWTNDPCLKTYDYSAKSWCFLERE